jgi:predicted MFS family arabinose efflux permease
LNFPLIWATNLVTICYRPNEGGKTQALNDFLVFGTTAAASFLADYLYEHFGWVPLNWASIPLLLVAVLAVTWLRFQREPARAAV